MWIQVVCVAVSRPVLDARFRLGPFFDAEGEIKVRMIHNKACSFDARRVRDIPLSNLSVSQSEM